MATKKLVRGSKEHAEAKAAGRAALDESTLGLEHGVRDDTEGHVEGEPGTWNTSGTEVAKPTELERDRYDEQVRNGAPGRVSPEGRAFNLAKAGDERVLAAAEESAAEAPEAVMPMPHSNQSRMAIENGLSMDEVAEKAAEQSSDAPSEK